MAVLMAYALTLHVSHTHAEVFVARTLDLNKLNSARQLLPHGVGKGTVGLRTTKVHEGESLQ